MSVKPLLLALISLTSTASAADHVIVISVDGLRPDAIDRIIGENRAPSFERFRQEGVWTHNARTDFGHTRTLPNNISMVTGRPVTGDLGHEWTRNDGISRFDTLHRNKDSYVASMYDVAHDYGLRTALYRSKEKLVILDQTYDSSDGAADTTGPNDGRRKIDFEESTDDDPDNGPRTAALLIPKLVADFAPGEAPIHLSYVHLVDPDERGHGNRWTTDEYTDAVADIDSYIGLIITAIEGNPTYAGNTAIILSTDHGGHGSSHSDENKRNNYTIPFYVWGDGVSAFGDLYALNGNTRIDPGSGRPDFGLTDQPIRNADAANLALDLLGLPPVPGSSINAFQDLAVGTPGPPPATGDVDVIMTFNPSGKVVLSWEEGIPASVQISSPSMDGWQNAPGRSWPSTDGVWTDSLSDSIPRRFYRLGFE